MKLSVIGINVTKAPLLQNSQLGDDFITKDIAYALICRSKDEVMEKGIQGKHIMGFMKDPKGKFEPKNFKGNTSFKQYIFELAAKKPDAGLKEALQKSQNGSVAMVDQRTKNEDGKVPPTEIIGMYKLEADGTIKFKGNPNYALVSQFGLAKFTPQIRKQVEVDI